MPEFDLDASVQDKLIFRAGGVIRIYGYVKGRPEPEITWLKDGEMRWPIIF